MDKKVRDKTKKKELAGESVSAPQENDSSSSLAKMLSVMDLFTVDKPVWSTTDILSALRASRSTGYRYIKALTSAGLLSAVGNGYYILGPRIIELDLQIRMTDPLSHASDGVLEQLVEATGHSALLCMLFQNSVLCIRECRAQLSPEKLFSRGQRRPLFQGAMSKAVLAYLPYHRLHAIFTRRQDTIGEAGLGSTWSEFREKMAAIRSDGFVQSVGEFNPGVVGIAAPIFNADEAIIGSIGLAFNADELEATEVSRVILLVKRASRVITDRMGLTESGLGMSPRAVG